MTHPEKAAALFRSGFNCSQAVFVAFCDVTGMNEETALKLSSSFGGGIGRLREVCGAVSGIAMVAGLLHGSTDPNDKQAKADHYALIQSLVMKFKEQNGSYICRELLALPSGPSTPAPSDRTPAFYQMRPCERFVYCAAEILDQLING